MDIFSRQERSRIMSRIRSKKNATTELRLIRLLKIARITGWRRNHKLFGSPDFVFREKRIALFVDGCFWHGCPKCYRRPLSNLKYWDMKVAKNRRRDQGVRRALRKAGWRVLRIWEHEFAKPSSVVRRISRLVENAVNSARLEQRRVDFTGQKTIIKKEQCLRRQAL